MSRAICAGSLTVHGTTLYIVDAGAKEVVAVDLNTGARSLIAGGLPIGAPPGVTPKPLRGIQPFSGPQGPFAGITGGPDGTLYVSADGEQFTYTSGATLPTSVGTMEGRYDMVGDDGTRFDAPIPPFTLAVPRTLH